MSIIIYISNYNNHYYYYYYYYYCCCCSYVSQEGSDVSATLTLDYCYDDFLLAKLSDIGNNYFL